MEIKPGDPLSRHHSKLAAKANKFGYQPLGGSGAADAFYSFGHDGDYRISVDRHGIVQYVSEFHDAWPADVIIGQVPFDLPDGK